MSRRAVVSVRELPPELRAKLGPNSPLLAGPPAKRRGYREREHWEQRRLLEWVDGEGVAQYPALDVLYAVPNGGARGKAQAGKLKAEGVRPGVPDLVLPVARWVYHGLYLELKAEGGAPSSVQLDWHTRLRREGYCVEVAYGWEAGRDSLVRYLNLLPVGRSRTP